MWCVIWGMNFYKEIYFSRFSFFFPSLARNLMRCSCSTHHISHSHSLSSLTLRTFLTFWRRHRRKDVWKFSSMSSEMVFTRTTVNLGIIDFTCFMASPSTTILISHILSQANTATTETTVNHLTVSVRQFRGSSMCNVRTKVGVVCLVLTSLSSQHFIEFSWSHLASSLLYVKDEFVWSRRIAAAKKWF